jgi:alpha-tubulin suppressor-like RCC1 family protein
MSADGSRIFWNSYEYDPNLNELGTLGTEIYCCNSNGSVAFGASQAIDGSSRLVIYNLPVSSSISVVDGHNQNFWYFNSANGTLGSVPMTVIESPSITQQPAANTGVTVGNAVYLTVTAIGLAPLSYQWTFSGTNLPAATNYFLSLPSVQTSQQGSYRVIVANPIGSVTSAVANVTVLVPPAITNQSPSTHVLAGQQINLSVAATGSTPLAYRWMFQNSTISGATASNLIINNAQQVNEGIYQAVVGNSVGSATSAVMFVRVDPAGPTIVTNPVSQTRPASSNATFAVTAIGSQPLGYQWFFNSAPIPGASAAQYSMSGIQASNGGSYYVIVSNTISAAASGVATLMVTPLAPYFTTQPVGASVSGGSSLTLTGIANGSLPITYQWQHNYTNIPGATRTALTLTNLGFSDSGPYLLIASNTAGTTPSSVAQLTVYQTPTLVGPLTNQVVDADANVFLSVNVLGSPTLLYSWRLNGQPIVGSSSALSITNIQPSQSGYYSVTVTNSFGSVSSTSRVSVLGPISTVVAWGDNSGGQLNVPQRLADVVAVAGGDYHTLVLRHDGTLLAWGYDGSGQTNVPTNALPFVAVASGTDHSLAVTKAGSLVAWGRNDLGQCNIPAAAANAVLAVAAGDAHSLALSSAGLVTAWGNNSYGQISVPQGLSGITAIAAGREHSLALRANGTVVGWGYNAYSQVSPPANLSNVVAIAGGYLHSAALLSNGTVVVWGDGSFGQTNVPAGLSNVVAIAAGDFNTLALLANGSVVGWGDDSYGQTDVPGNLRNVISVASGNFHGLALTPTAGLLSATLSPAGLILNWTGNATLQWAPASTGPFTDIPMNGNSYTNTDMTASEKFFRLRR